MFYALRMLFSCVYNAMAATYIDALVMHASRERGRKTLTFSGRYLSFFEMVEFDPDFLQVGVSCILIVLLSYCLAKFGIMREKDYRRLDRFCSKFCFPIMQFQCCAMKKIDEYDFRPLLNQVLMNVASQVVLCFVFILPLRDRLETYLNLTIAGVFVNYLPIGLKIIEAFYGPGYDSIIGICPLSNFLVLVPFFLIWAQIWHMRKDIAAGDETVKRRITAKDVGRAFLNSITNPIIIATILGVVYSATRFDYPIFLQKFGAYPNDCVLLIALFSVGNVLKNNGFIACHWFELVSSLLVRFVLCPCLSWLFVWALGVKGLMARFGILFAAMPASNGAYVIAQTADAGVPTTSSTIFFSLILIVPVVYVYVFLFDYFHLYEYT